MALRARVRCDAMVKRIRVEGLVQGVGFRPFVWQLARERGIFGSVVNLGGAVEIYAQGNTEQLAGFVDALKNKAPALARVERVTAEEASGSYVDFTILKSAGDDPGVSIPPDLGLCEACEAEILDVENHRRHRHCFSGCVNCGPRFTVLRSMPYDRKNTAWAPFDLCPDCQNEYLNPLDRRHSAENNCCANCGPTLTFRQGGQVYQAEEAMARAVDAIKAGNVIAVKGVGGYHLCCSPYDEAAVAQLRKLKRRDAKPLAVMFRDCAAVAEICDLSEPERALLCSPARPITLLRLKRRVFAPSVLQGTQVCGCFLPYTPLHRLLLEELNAVVLTSANLSGGAIAVREDALQAFAAHTPLSGILTNDREIVRSAEDSVCQVTGGQPQILRRSRGYVPGAFRLVHASANFLAMGGDLKASFALVKQGHACLSPYFGDLQEASVLQAYMDGIHDFQRLFRSEPQFAVCDMHPGYVSSKIAEELGLPVLRAQHHHAHAASVLAEHELAPETRAIAVVLDGAGYAEDGSVWGGEFFVYEDTHFTRRGHLRSIDILGADSAAVDAEKTALCYLAAYGIDPPAHWAAHRFAKLIKPALSAGVNTYHYTGAGRLFDAVAALTGVCGVNRYEGECAVLLEQAAHRAANAGVCPDFMISDADGCYVVDPAEILKAAAATRSKESDGFAYGFHAALARAVTQTVSGLAGESGIGVVLLSGGVFQNRLLTEMITPALEKVGLKVYQNRRVPPNDGGLALGQAYLAALLM